MRQRVLPPTLVLIMVMSMIASFVVPVAAAPAAQGPEVTPSAIFRGVSTAVKFDVSPPLSSITPLVPQESKPFEIPERGTGLEGAFGPQDADAALQTTYGPSLIPAPIVSFDGPSNISSVSPPDPVGDVGPNHYIAMSNLSFQIFNKSGGSLYGPALNNTLWAGFGGPCQTENSGDPIVLYDQLDDRWILSQFTSAGPTYYNCLAVSTTPDPLGTYYLWAISNGNNFPDYPKLGMWPDALYFSNREFAGGATFAGIGAYAINRAQMIAGNPAAQVISFLVPPTPAYNVGDGLLPTDMDGSTLPPAGSPNYFVGAMDDGATYGATQDALTLWKFHVDFATPGNSTFTLANTLPIAAYDTIPAFCSGRACIPQPGTANKIDHLGYRQRPMWRLAYRNFGTHESLVTNQSVEASATMSGIRWWEIRSPNSSPVVYQEGTYAPGLNDGIFRWMGSIAQDSAGNMALGYSASNGTTTYPSSWYTGRLASDPLGTMPQGEGSIINGTGSQTGSNRWGDYTSMNVDPVDDCTFWYVNQYVPTTSSVGWRLRIGAFKFNECGTADFTIASAPASQEICVGAVASYNVTIGSVSGYSNPVTLSASGNPGSAGFSTNPVTPPGSSTMTISGAAAGTYNFNVVGTAAGPNVHQAPVGLTVQAAAPSAPVLTAPANGALNVPATPTFTWNAAAGAATYSIQVATDAGFTNVVASASGLTGTTWSGASLNTNTMYYWRVQATNACGTGTYSSVFNFSTVAAPGDCAAGTVPNILYQYGFESGASGWTSSAAIGTDTWTIATANPHSGTSHYRALDPATVSDQRLVSPGVALPTGQNPVVLKFWHVPNLEPSGTTACFDGGILEVSTDGGATWTQVPNANLLAGPYRGLVSSSFSNPLAGLNAWCGTTTYINTIADVSAYAGQTAQFRMRLGSDSSVTNPGWDVDDVTVQSCQPAVVDPNIDVSPLSMSATQATNTTTQQTLTVANTGGGTLNWTIAEDNNPAPPLKPMPVVVPVAAPASEQVNAAAPAAPAQPEKAPTLWQRPEIVLYDNGPLVTHPGAGAGGADASAVQTDLGMTTNGFGVQLTAGNRLADDFTISDPNGWTIDTITLFLYQSNSTTTSPITAVNLQIWDGSPDLGTSTVVFGDTTTNRLASTSWANMYRVPITGLTGTARPVMANVVTVGTHLAPGTYWVDWQADGDAGLTGPWNPPITILGQTSTGNALQYTGAWAPIADVGTTTPQGLPFIVNGIVGYPPACVTPNAIPWLSLTPTSGSNAGSTNTPVQVTFDSTALAVGTYTANLCVTSNDPDPGSGNGTDLVIVPITLTVQTPTAVTLGSLAANASQSPVPAAIPVGALPAAAGLAMAAVYALRRRR